MADPLARFTLNLLSHMFLPTSCGSELARSIGLSFWRPHAHTPGRNNTQVVKNNLGESASFSSANGSKRLPSIHG